MTRALVPSVTAQLERARQPPPRSLYELWLEGRKPRTLQAYKDDLERFAAFTGNETVGEAVAELLALSHGEANELAFAFRNALVADGLAPATVNRRLGALRSITKFGNLLGRCAWTIAVPGVKAEKRRDTRGPTDDEVRRLLKALDADVRGRAIFVLLYATALRRGEVAELRVCHFNAERGELSIVGKGRTERIWLTLPPSVAKAIAAWCTERGAVAPDASLFDLTGGGIYAWLRRLAKVAGVGAAAHPHGLRHSGITKALELEDNLSKVQGFSRHAKLQTLVDYNDARQDRFGDVAARVADDLESEE